MQGENAEKRPKHGGGGDQDEVSGVAGGVGQPADGRCGPGVRGCGSDKGAGELAEVERGDGDQTVAVQQDGERDGVGEDA